MNDSRLEIILAAKDVTGQTFVKVKDQIKSLKSSVFSLNGAIGTLAGGYGLGMLAGSFLQTARDFERFEIMLGTIQGSSTKAKASMDWISDFTASTPYELGQVTDAFIKLEACGLSGTRWLGTLGDTASSMGKDLNQAVEMFADAVTGEFERLKEFGVKASQQGDQVTFKWSQNGKDMVVTADKTEGGISSALEKIFVRFKGGMDKQAGTLDGILSNMADQMTMVQKSWMDAGIFEEIKTGVSGISSEFSNWVTANENLIKQNIPKYIDQAKTAAGDTYEVLKDIKDLYDSIPDDLKGPMGIGLVGAAMFGPTGGFVLGGSTFVFKEVKDFLEGIEGMQAGKISLGEFIGDEDKFEAALARYRKFKKDIQSVDKQYAIGPGTQGYELYSRTHGQDEEKPSDNPLPYTAPSGSGTVKKKKSKNYQNLFSDLGGPQSMLAEHNRLLEDFEDKYQSTMLSSYDYERLQLQKTYESFQGHVGDKVQLMEWYGTEMKRITAAEAKAAEDAAIKIKNPMQDSLDAIKDAVENTFGSVEDALVDMVTTGKFEFSSLVDSIISDLARMAIQEGITGPLKNMLFGGDDSGGGFLGNLFGGLFSAQGNVFHGGHLAAFGSGGAFTNSLVSSPTFFKYGSGGSFGVMGEAGPEAVLPLKRTPGGNLGVEASGGGAVNVSVQVINNTGRAAEAQTQDPRWDGEKWVIGVILEAVQTNKGGFRNTMKGALI